MSAKPFLKWPGGKRSLLPEILRRVPPNVRGYFEPFVGGGAVFFELANRKAFREATLGDANRRLFRTYVAVRDDLPSVLRRLARHRNDEDYFYRTRAKKIDREKSDAAVAAWMVYVNKTCFNGLYRENRAGEFNAPFGHYANPRILDRENLEACSAALRGVRVALSDFSSLALKARPGDFVYFDPPYLPRGKEFTSYGAGGFGYKDHVRLRDVARRLKDRGVSVLLSNSSAEAVHDLYADGFLVEEVVGRRTISASGGARGRVGDVLIS